MTDGQIDTLIARRAKLTNRRDGWIDFGKVDAIDAKLSAACPAGQRNDVDLLLGRPCATLQSDEPDVKWAGRAVYLTTTVDNGVEWNALVEHSTHDTVAEARAAARHNLEWFGVGQGFKTTCRISIDNAFEEISTYIPPKRVVMVQHVDGTQSVDEQWADQTEDYLDWIASRGDCAL